MSVPVSATAVQRYPEAGMHAAKVMSAYMLKVARPLYWHIGVGNKGVLRGATTFILQFAERYVAVTADHVLQQYLDACSADARTICQIGEVRVWLERCLVGRSAPLDIATFEIDPTQLPAMGAIASDCRRYWPPEEIKVGESLTLAGYPDAERSEVGKGHYEMRAWGAHSVVDGINERDIVTVYDPLATFAADGTAKPPLAFNMSGCSGGPAILIKDVNGFLRWFPVGLIYKGAGEKGQGEFATFDQIHVRRLHFIRPDGTISEPTRGWLP
jgi:hypothetical protein